MALNIVKTIRIHTKGGAEVVVLFSDVGDDHHVDVYPANPSWSEEKIHRFLLLGLVQLAMEKPGDRVEVLLDPLLGVVDGGENVH